MFMRKSWSMKSYSLKNSHPVRELVIASVSNESEMKFYLIEVMVN